MRISNIDSTRFLESQHLPLILTALPKLSPIHVTLLLARIPFIHALANTPNAQATILQASLNTIQPSGDFKGFITLEALKCFEVFLKFAGDFFYLEKALEQAPDLQARLVSFLKRDQIYPSDERVSSNELQTRTSSLSFKVAIATINVALSMQDGVASSTLDQVLHQLKEILESKASDERHTIVNRIYELINTYRD